jgi:hypothetical protein
LFSAEQHGPGKAVQFRIPKMLAGARGCVQCLPYCGQRGRAIAMPDQTLGEECQAVWQMSRAGIDVIYFGS